MTSRGSSLHLLQGCEILVGGMRTTGERRTFSLEGLRWHLLALCVVILNQVLEEVHSFLGLDLVYFDQVLQEEERCRVQPRGEIQVMFIGFFMV